MNKIKFLLPMFLSLSVLSSCFGGSSKPTNAKEKVTYAFNGVDSSLKNQKPASKKALPRLAIKESEAITELYGQFDGKEAASAPGLEYAQPPLVQFQFMKQLYEATGDSYELGVTYTASVSGTANYDFSTGKSGVEQTYTSDISMVINIDSSDLITAEFGMQTVFTDASSNKHEQYFYAHLDLDYDFSADDHNFVLKMRTSDDCSRFKAEEAYNSYEYDYVSVKHNSIEEWRKAYVTSSKKIATADFATYNDGTLEFAGRGKAYKEGYSYATMHTGTRDAQYLNNRVTLATTLVDKLGCNASDIKADAFFARNKTNNPKVVDIYNGFSKTYGVNIAESMAICAAHIYEDGDVDDSPSFLRIKNELNGEEYHDEGTAILANRNATIADLFSNRSIYSYDADLVPVFEIFRGDGNYLREATQADLSVAVIADDNNAITPNWGDLVTDIAARLNSSFLYIAVNLMNGSTVKDSKSFPLYIPEEEVPSWPVDLLKSMYLDTVIPAFTSTSPKLVINSYMENDTLYIEITGVEYSEYENYLSLCLEKGLGSFGKDNGFIFTNTKKQVYTMATSNYSYISLTIAPAGEEYQATYSSADLSIFSELNQDVLFEEGTIFTHPQNRNDLFDFYGVSEKKIEAYTTRLTSNGWTLDAEQTDDSLSTYYYDYNSYRYQIVIYFNYGYITLYFSSWEISSIDLSVCYLVVEGESYEMNKVSDSKMSITKQFSAYQDFHLEVGKERKVYGFEFLDANAAAEGYVTTSDGQSIRTMLEGEFTIAFEVRDGYGWINITYAPSQEEEGVKCEVPYVDFKDVALVGSFNSWDETSMGYAFYGPNDKGVYYFTTQLKAGAKFKICYDGSWTNCLGYKEVSAFASFPTLLGESTDDTDSNIAVLAPTELTIKISKGESVNYVEVNAKAL